MKIDENELASQVTLAEGRKVNTNVAQVKEVVRLTLDILARHYGIVASLRLLWKHRKGN